MGFQDEIDQAIKQKKLYFIGDSLPSDWYAAFKQWLPLAEAGDPKAQFNIGRCYNLGNGIDQDTNQSVHWLMKAAAQGDPRAHFNMHLRCEDNNDDAGSSDWLTKAINLKEPRALEKIKENALNDERKIAEKFLAADDKETAKPLYQLLVDKGDGDSELGLIASDIEITIMRSGVANHYSYNQPISSTGGYISSGGTGGGTTYNQAIIFKIRNKSIKPATVSVWVQKYDYKNPLKKIGEDKRLDFPTLRAGESAELVEEFFPTPRFRAYMNSYTIWDEKIHSKKRLNIQLKDKLLVLEGKGPWAGCLWIIMIPIIIITIICIAIIMGK